MRSSMTTRLRLTAIPFALVALVGLAAALPVAQGAHPPHQASPVSAATLTRQIALRTGIGHASETVATKVPAAQAFYAQGLEYLHSYVWVEAARSFNQALRLDPNLPLAYVGLSYADIELNDSPAAHDSLARAQALAARASAHDRTRVELRAKQMAAEDSPQDKTLLAAYRVALDAASKQYPNDVELWLLRGIAESADPAERGQGSPAASIPFYEKAMALAPKDDAPHHFLAHAYENSGREAEAQKEASVYATMAPAIPHAQHMLGHTMERSGRMDRAIAAFEAADRLERAYISSESVAPEHDWHFEHNLDLLGAAYEYVGQMKNAERVFKEAFDLPTTLAEEGFNKRNWPEFLIACGRSTEAAAAGETLTQYPSTLVAATGHLEQARALMASRDFAKAASEANDALRDMRQATDGAAMLADTMGEVQGEFLLRTNDREKGQSMLRTLAAHLQAAPGPDTWIDGLFTLEAVDKAARDVDDWTFAGWAAAEMRAYDPAYGGTHLALALSAEHDGDHAQARTEFAAAAKAWATADPDLPELLLARGQSR
jgi:tetratricopeptide (TPR) repeat protein